VSVRTQRNSLPLLSLNFKVPRFPDDYFSDDFNDASIRSGWLKNNVDANRTIVEDSDVLTISVAAATQARWLWTFNDAPTLYQALYPGMNLPVEFITKINTFTLNDNYHTGIFIGYHDAVLFGREAYLFGPCREGGETGVKVKGSGNVAGYSMVLGATSPKWLKIKVSADEVITFYHSDDGSDWTQYQTFVGAVWVDVEISGWFEDDMEVGLFAQGITAPTADVISAPFDFFQIQILGNVEYLAPIDTRAPTTFYDGRIKQMSSLKRAVDDKTGLFQIADMSVTLANEDKHYSQMLASHILKNQEATLYHAWTEEDEDLKLEIIKLIVEDHSMKGPDFIIKFKDITQKYFTKKVPENICTSDEFPDIHPDYEGACMPEILGNASLSDAYEHPGAVQAIYVDTTGPPYRCLASAGLITIPTDEVWIGDVQKTTPAQYSVVQTDGRTYIHFVAGQDPGDDTVAFNAHGYSIPAWDSANGYIQNLAYIIEYFLRFIMDIPTTLVNAPSFATLAGYYEEMGVDENCYLILQDREDGMEVLRQLLFTGGAKGFMAMDGKFNVKRKNICNWEITPGGPAHIFEQIELFGSPHRKWNLTSAINTVNVEYGLIPWQNFYTGAKSEYRDNRYERDMEDDIRRERERQKRQVW